MLRSVSLRLSRRSSRSIRLSIFFIVAVLFIDIFHATEYYPSVRVFPSDYELPRKVFIASIHRNNEQILRSHWNKALLNLVQFLGPENVYVSIFESGSFDNTKGALKELDQQLSKLKVSRSIVLDDHNQLEEVGATVTSPKPGWIWTGRMFELRRIPYLANLRNKVMDRLYDQQEDGKMYDFILWLNDVVFTTEDITTLLSTNDGSYSAVCSLDFSVPNVYYDTFALRDFHGQKVLQSWPFFLSSQNFSRNQPVRVESCWNGIVAFKPTPFYTHRLKFRGISDSLASYHLEGSECCLIHADNPSNEGVWLNPNVRVGYNPSAYELVNPKGPWPEFYQKLIGICISRLAWITWPKRFFEAQVVNWRVNRWKKEGAVEPGVNCLINEMQVLFESGWLHA